MAPHYYSNSYGYSGGGGGGGFAGGGFAGGDSPGSNRSVSSSSSSFPSFYRLSRRDQDSSTSPLDDFLAFLSRSARSLWAFWRQRGRHILYASLVRALRQLRRNLTPTRLFSLPHLLVGLSILVLLWGERWVFHSRVESCQWSNWENWVWQSLLVPSFLILF